MVGLNLNHFSKGALGRKFSNEMRLALALSSLLPPIRFMQKIKYIGALLTEVQFTI